MSKNNAADCSELVRFDLNKSTEYNFNMYQDAIQKHPESSYQLKLRYDQYLKTQPLFKKEQKVEVQHDISFEVTG